MTALQTLAPPTHPPALFRQPGIDHLIFQTPTLGTMHCGCRGFLKSFNTTACGVKSVFPPQKLRPLHQLRPFFLLPAATADGSFTERYNWMGDPSIHRWLSVPIFLLMKLTRFTLLATLVLAAHLDAADAPPPHIVFHVADDMGGNDVGFNGGKEIKTPNLDALAAAGARFDAFYVQPVCSPTRAALLTGRYPMRYGLQTGVVRPWTQYGLPLEERTLAQALREAGYATAIVGKWHLGPFALA